MGQPVFAPGKKNKSGLGGYFPGRVWLGQKILTHFAMSTHHHTQAQPATTTHNHMESTTEERKKKKSLNLHAISTSWPH